MLLNLLQVPTAGRPTNGRFLVQLPVTLEV